MDGAIDGKEGYEETDHGPFLNMVSLLFPCGKRLVIAISRPGLSQHSYLVEAPTLVLHPQARYARRRVQSYR